MTFIATLLLLGVVVVPSSAVELLPNGNFETGDFFIDAPGTHALIQDFLVPALGPQGLEGTLAAAFS